MTIIYNNEAIKLSGVTPEHARWYLTAASAYKSCIMLRGVGEKLRGLYLEGYATKSFHIKAKSCSWGPMAGFVCEDLRLNKRPTTDIKTQQSQLKTLLHSIEDDRLHGFIPIMITRERIFELLHMGLITDLAPSPYNDRDFVCCAMDPSTESQGGVRSEKWSFLLKRDLTCDERTIEIEVRNIKKQVPNPNFHPTGLYKIQHLRQEAGSPSFSMSPIASNPESPRFGSLVDTGPPMKGDFTKIPLRRSSFRTLFGSLRSDSVDSLDGSPMLPQSPIALKNPYTCYYYALASFLGFSQQELSEIHINSSSLCVHKNRCIRQPACPRGSLNPSDAQIQTSYAISKDKFKNFQVLSETIEENDILAVVDSECPDIEIQRKNFRCATISDHDLFAIFPLKKKEIDYFKTVYKLTPEGEVVSSTRTVSAEILEKDILPEPDSRETATRFGLAKGNMRLRATLMNRLPYLFSPAERYQAVDKGIITMQVESIINFLNQNIRYPTGVLIHHGDEAGNPIPGPLALPFIAFFPKEGIQVPGQATKVTSVYIDNENDYFTFLEMVKDDYILNIGPNWPRERKL